MHVQAFCGSIPADQRESSRVADGFRKIERFGCKLTQPFTQFWPALGEDLFGDGVRRQKSANPQQIGRSRVFRGQPGESQGKRDRHRSMLRGDFSSMLAKPGSFGLIKSQVFRRSGRRLFDKRPGLIERQRETVDFVGNLRGGDPVGFRSRLKGGPMRNQTRAAEQEERAVLRLHFVDFHQFRDASGTVQASRDQAMAGRMESAGGPCSGLRRYRCYRGSAAIPSEIRANA